MICKELIHAKKMVEYVIRRPEVVERVLQIFQNHMSSAIDSVLGPARRVAPMFVSMEGIADAVVRETLKELPQHSQQIMSFMDSSFALQETLSFRLSRLHPERFE